MDWQGFDSAGKTGDKREIKELIEMMGGNDLSVRIHLCHVARTPKPPVARF
jgi:hypothetical protein